MTAQKTHSRKAGRSWGDACAEGRAEARRLVETMVVARNPMLMRATLQSLAGEYTDSPTGRAAGFAQEIAERLMIAAEAVQ